MDGRFEEVDRTVSGNLRMEGRDRCEWEKRVGR